MTAQQLPAAIGPLWAPLCRNVLPKGFTGKGEALRWRNELIVALAQVHAAMRTLHRATKAVRSRFFYLERFRRGQTGAVTLRWRQTTGRYVTWPTLQPSVRQLPCALRAWYAEAQQYAAWLNAQECALRHALGLAERLLREGSASTASTEAGNRLSPPSAVALTTTTGEKHEQ